MNKIILGDAIKEMKKIPNNSIDALITDPPYNLVEKIGTIHLFKQTEMDNKNGLHTKESMSFDKGFDQITWLKEAVRVLKKGGTLIIFNDWENMGDISKELKKLKIKVKALNHWQKTNPLPVEWKRRFTPGREYFLHAIKPGKYTFNVKSVHYGYFIMSTTPGREKKHGRHPNQKPLQLMEEIISITTNKNDIVLDPFCGSGSTLLACKNLNRNYIGIELDKEFYQLSKRRLK